jgi:hypothetical protein
VSKFVALIVATFVFAALAGAQEQQSFRNLMSKGYDIKSATFARGQFQGNADRELFVITLQKEKSVAVCTFAAANWINLSTSYLEDSKTCDVRY